MCSPVCPLYRYREGEYVPSLAYAGSSCGQINLNATDVVTDPNNPVRIEFPSNANERKALYDAIKAHKPGNYKDCYICMQVDSLVVEKLSV